MLKCLAGSWIWSDFRAVSETANFLTSQAVVKFNPRQQKLRRRLSTARSWRFTEFR